MRIIYKFTNSINKKVYIGQTNHLSSRISSHKHDALKRNYNYPLHNAIRKYGFDKFEVSILETVEDIYADKSEIFWIDFYKSSNRDFGYNIELGGNFNCRIMSEETKQKISIARKIYFAEDPYNNPMYGKHHTDETKQKISDANNGKCYNTPEHMDKLHKITSQRLKGSHLSDETKDKLSKANIGRKHSEESKQKMSKTRVDRGTFAGSNNPNFGKTGELNPSAKLNWEIVKNIRNDYFNGVRGKKLMIKYNISETNMYRIIKNEIWKED